MTTREKRKPTVHRTTIGNELASRIVTELRISNETSRFENGGNVFDNVENLIDTQRKDGVGGIEVGQFADKSQNGVGFTEAESVDVENWDRAHWEMSLRFQSGE